MAETNDSCYVDVKLYKHLFLIPAAIILAVLAFLNKRKNYRKDILQGRPALVIPFDFLGFDHNRFAIAAIFGAVTGLIVQVIESGTTVTGSNNWSKAFGIIVLCLEIAFLCYPLFACLTTSYKVIGSVMGLLYTLSWAIVSFMIAFSSKCQGVVIPVSVIIANLPSLLCYLFILGKYVTVLCFESRTTRSWKDENEDYKKSQKCLAKPGLITHVRELLYPRFQMIEKKWRRYMRVIYSPDKDFHFSVQTLSIVVICSIFLFQIGVPLIDVALQFIESDMDIAPGLCKTKTTKLAGISLLLAVLVTAFTAATSLVCFMDCHKKNMLRIFRGDTSFISNSLKKSQSMLGKCLKYTGFQIGYFVWGCILTTVIIWVVTVVIIALFDCPFAWDWFKNKVVYLVAFWVVAVIIWVVRMVSSLTLFRDRSYDRNVIALENRNLYLVFSYFFFFLALPMGIFSAILRILKAMVIGFFMLPRIDRSIFPAGLQQFDKGYAAYICYLNVLATHRNPVLRVFCQLVYDGIEQPDHTLKSVKRYHNKWSLLLTLMNNPELQALRKHALKQPTVAFRNDCAMSSVIES